MKIGNSFNTQTPNFVNQNKTNAEQALSKIGAMRELSGKDTANLIVSNELSSQISTLTQSIQNENESVAMYQIADSAVQGLSEDALKLNDLSVSMNNAALNDTQKNFLKNEFSATVNSMKDNISQTSYNGKDLLSSQLNLNVTGLDNVSIDNQDSISSLMQNLNSLSSDIGAHVNKSEVSLANSLGAVSNLTSSYANISESPMDQKINDLHTNEIKLTSSIMAQVHQTQSIQQRMSALLG
jgi:flagellin